MIHLEAPKRQNNWPVWVALTTLVVLVGFSCYLSVNRIYQVDEAQNIFMATVVGRGQASAYFTTAALWLLGPLAWLGRTSASSTDLFFWNRLIFLAIFWINTLLMALNTGVQWKSKHGLFALLAAATLAPFWDYGIEVRHDNLILLVLLLVWWLGRTRPRGTTSYILIGALIGFLQFAVFKAFVYWVPLCAALIAFPHPGHRRGRMRLALAWCIGVLAAFVLCAGVYASTGLWGVYLQGLRGGLEASGGGSRFGPWMALSRLFIQAPLVTALAFAALVCLGLDLHTHRRQALSWDGLAPEGLLLMGSLAALCINPTPFPYNLINVVPFAFLLACRLLAERGLRMLMRTRLLAVFASMVFVTHAVPFITSTWRHLGKDNERQQSLMNLAEFLTDPMHDPVYDAVGMVPTRTTIHYRWYLHSLNIHMFLDDRRQSVSEMLRLHPAAVLIPNYRTDWLSQEDWAFIASRYVPLADDFWILGQILPAGGSAFEVVHPGRYQIMGATQKAMAALQGGHLDGQEISSSIVYLNAGPHQLTAPSQIRPAFFWVGPKAIHLPSLPQSHHLQLFTNWY